MVLSHLISLTVFLVNQIFKFYKFNICINVSTAHGSVRCLGVCCFNLVYLALCVFVCVPEYFAAFCVERYEIQDELNK